jgi:hypothetical protein
VGSTCAKKRAVRSVRGNGERRSKVERTWAQTEIGDTPVPILQLVDAKYPHGEVAYTFHCTIALTTMPSPARKNPNVILLIGEKLMPCRSRRGYSP